MKRKKKAQPVQVIKTNILKVRNELHFDAQLRFPALITKNKKAYDRKKEKVKLRKLINQYKNM